MVIARGSERVEDSNIREAVKTLPVVVLALLTPLLCALLILGILWVTYSPLRTAVAFVVLGVAMALLWRKVRRHRRPLSLRR